jgi:hypothetical protein
MSILGSKQHNNYEESHNQSCHGIFKLFIRSPAAAAAAAAAAS